MITAMQVLENKIKGLHDQISLSNDELHILAKEIDALNDKNKLLISTLNDIFDSFECDDWRRARIMNVMEKIDDNKKAA